MVSAALTHPENRGDGVWWKLEAGELGFEPESALTLSNGASMNICASGSCASSDLASP
jgi:hypothetical protein